MRRRSEHDPIEVIAPQHLMELADFLGQPIGRLRETLRLHLQVLSNLGYELMTTDTDPTRRLTPPSPPPQPKINWVTVAAAVEDGLAEVTERRFHRERVSDQEEVRVIVAAIRAVVEPTEG